MIWISLPYSYSVGRQAEEERLNTAADRLETDWIVPPEGWLERRTVELGGALVEIGERLQQTGSRASIQTPGSRELAGRAG